MIDKLRQAIKEEYSYLTDAEVNVIANFVDDEYNVCDDDDLEYAIDRLYVYQADYDAMSSETEDRRTLAVVMNMKYSIIEPKDVGKTMAQLWLEECGYHLVDISGNDIWFTMYE